MSQGCANYHEALLDIEVEDDASDATEASEQPAKQPRQDEPQGSAGSEKTDQRQVTEASEASGPSKELEKKLPAPPSTAAIPAKKSAGLVTPAVRHMLKGFNLDVSDIQGTGKDGRVLKEDVQRHAAAMGSPSSSVSTPPSKPVVVVNNNNIIAEGEDRLVPLTPIQNQMFQAMTRSLSIPHFLYTHQVDLTSLNALRKRLKTHPELSSHLRRTPEGCWTTAKLTLLPFVLKALSHAFAQFPILNSHLDTETNPDRPQLLIKASHNFGIAVDTPQGLLVPVVRDVQNHSILSLAAEIERLSNLAREGRLSPQEMKGATFTISNIGSIGGGGGGHVVSPVILAPMVGILAIGRAQEVPVFQKDDKNSDGEEKIVKREQVILSWSADHRILDGATVARCAQSVGSLLENIEALGIALK